MCEQCKALHELAWTEMRDLMNYHRKNKGPLSLKYEKNFNEAFEEAAEQGMDVDDENRRRMFIDAIIAEQIAWRCAFVARSSVDTPTHNVPGSVILGTWAGELMQLEMRASSGTQILNLLEKMIGGDDDDS